MKKIKITKHFLKKLILPTIIFVQFLLIGVLAWYVYWTRIDANLQSTDKISTLIIRSVEAINLPTPTDAQTGRVYIHEATITLPPAPDRSHKLYYFYNPPYQDSQPELRLSDKANVDMQKSKLVVAPDLESMFNIVPKLQACSRGYQVFFSLPGEFDTDGKLVFTKKLKDGRTAHVYKEDGCSDNKSEMVPYLQQMDSY